MLSLYSRNAYPGIFLATILQISSTIPPQGLRESPTRLTSRALLHFRIFFFPSPRVSPSSSPLTVSLTHSLIPKHFLHLSSPSSLPLKPLLPASLSCDPPSFSPSFSVSSFSSFSSSSSSSSSVTSDQRSPPHSCI
ncbi:hypothetical protein E2C01_031954 [Portunus trituberculatus]|uniref:Uncharacterized protein n=1 Tax=Portunus trituberculatus TaxID=210409 RepID=A0A5B7EZ19_PORTR|nr:hypothetical protein [Portunus trituberculatus]